MHADYVMIEIAAVIQEIRLVDLNIQGQALALIWRDA